MSELSDLENRSIYIIREAYAEFKNPAVLWSTGKDSTATLWLCREAFFGKIPFPVIHIDTTYKFKPMYEFRDRLAKEWGMDLIVVRNEEAIKAGVHAGRIAGELAKLVGGGGGGKEYFGQGGGTKLSNAEAAIASAKKVVQSYVKK
jgi:3'-phosphoadenosine 5'-phosphosulfate sulfotransferase (PAPS reductase)/FAD synthetase